MSSILDIDLDYFNLTENPVQRLAQLLAWADCPVSFVIENHHESLRRWKNYIKRGRLHAPRYILHVDEHHDMMDEKTTPNIANFVYHAMWTWPEVRVHWFVEEAIDSPAVWLSDDTWEILSRRFSWGSHIPHKWPRPQVVSVCTSSEFVSVKRRTELMAIIEKWMSAEHFAAPDGGTASLNRRG